MEKDENGENGSSAFVRYLRSHPASLKAYLRRFLPDALSEKFEIDSFGWVEGLVDSDDGILTIASEVYSEDIQQLINAKESSTTTLIGLSLKLKRRITLYYKVNDIVWSYMKI